MKIIQILILAGFALYLLFTSINFMDNYSRQAIAEFRSERTMRIIKVFIIVALLYLAGTFNLLFPSIWN